MLLSSSVTSNTATGGTGGGAVSAVGAAGGEAIAGIGIDPGAGAVGVSGSDLSNNAATGGTGGRSNGGSSFADGAGGVAMGAIGDLGAASLAVTASTVNGNTATGGTGGGGGGPNISPAGTGGLATGGAIDDTGGPLVITDSTFDGNQVTGGNGGVATLTLGVAGDAGEGLGGALAIIAPASLVVRRATIALDTAQGGTAAPSFNGSAATGANGADGVGGGVYAAGGTQIVDATVAEDVARGSAGAAFFPNTPAGTPGIGAGGGIAVQAPGTSVLAHDTLAANAAQSAGGGGTFGGDLDVGNVATTIAGTIFAGGTATTGSNCALFASGITDLGDNLEQTTGQCHLTAAGDISGQDPLLGQLTDNGGPGPTLASASASPARGAGGACTDPTVSGNPPLGVDERGTKRHAACDIGACETQPPTVTAPPVLSGPVVVGATLTCPSSGFAGDAPLGFAYAWLRAGTAIAGATAAAYTTGSADIGQAVSCSITASNAYGAVSSASDAVTVNAPPATPSGGVTFTGATLSGSTLTADGKGHVTARLACPKTTPGGKCKVVVTIVAAGGRRVSVLGRGKITISAGNTGKLRVALTKRGRRAVRHLPLKVKLTLVSTDRAGADVTAHVKARIVAAKRRVTRHR